MVQNNPQAIHPNFSLSLSLSQNKWHACPGSYKRNRVGKVMMVVGIVCGWSVGGLGGEGRRKGSQSVSGVSEAVSQAVSQAVNQSVSQSVSLSVRGVSQ